MSRLTWAAVSPLLAGLYADHPVAWPQVFAPLHLARLQLPEGAPLQRTAYAQAIEQACAAGELPSAPAKFTKWPAILGMHGDGSDTEESLRAQCAVFTWPAIRAADFLAWLVRERAEPSAHVRAWLAATGGAAATATAHRLKTRSDRLSAAIARATAEAIDPTDWASVWAALVRLAEGASPPAPLIEFAQGEIKYSGDDGPKFLSRGALRKRLQRARARTQAPAKARGRTEP